MRNISAASLAKITQQNGAEPIGIVGVVWASAELFYCDKWISETVPGKLLKLENVESVTSLDGSGGTSSLNILLDDTDGTLKNILDSTDIHRRPVAVYQWFDGIDFNEKFVTYEGVIESPIVYSDSDRTLSFSVVTINEHQEIGFAPEEGQFPNLPSGTVGQAWPMCFGSPRHVPGLTYQYPTVGTILNPLLVLAPALDVIPPVTSNFELPTYTSSTTAEAVPRNNYGASGEIVTTPQFNTSEDLTTYQQQQTSASTGATLGGNFKISEGLAAALDMPLDINSDQFGNIPPPGESSFIIDGQEYDDHDYTLAITSRWTQTPGSFNRTPRTIQPNESAYYYIPGVRQELRAKGTRTDGVYLLNGGIGFPIGQWIELSMANHLFRGYLGFDGFLKLRKINLPGATPAYYSGSLEDLQAAPSAQTAFNIMQNTTFFTPDGTLTIEEYGEKQYYPHFDRSGQVSVGYRLQQGRQSDGFQVYPAGTQLHIIGDYSIDYIVNIFPCLVTQVWGYRSVNNVKQLVPVSMDRWKQVAVNFGTITVQVVRLKRLLSLYPGENWEDGIYVDLTSAVGPNPVDIMQTIITVYCPDLSYDPVSFEACRLALGDYPMNFYISEKPEVLAWLQEIAYQCRCAIYVKDRTFFLKYLSYEAVPVDTITANDVIEGSIEVTTTETENIVTRLAGSYTPDYAREERNQVIKRNNIARYGLFKEEHSFFAYTSNGSVQKTVSYWIIIRSNVWKRIKFSTPLHKLSLETFDNIIFDIPGVVADVPVNCRIESTSYDSDKNQIDFECWTPVRLGEMLPYPLAYPADSETDYAPLRLQDFDADPYRDFRQFNQGLLATIPGQQTNDSTGPAGADTLDTFFHNQNQSAAQTFDNQGLQTLDPANTPYALTDVPFPTNDTADLPDPTVEPIVPPDETALGESLDLPLPPPADAPISEVYGRRKPLRLNPVPTPAAIPGKIIGPSSTTGSWSVQIWPRGLDNNSETVDVRQLQIADMEDIPVGTSVLVSKACVGREGNSSSLRYNYEYTMQVPVWLA